jgi:hypothetical protein
MKFTFNILILFMAIFTSSSGISAKAVKISLRVYSRKLLFYQLFHYLNACYTNSKQLSVHQTGVVVLGTQVTFQMTDPLEVEPLEAETPEAGALEIAQQFIFLQGLWCNFVDIAMLSVLLVVA